MLVTFLVFATTVLILLAVAICYLLPGREKVSTVPGLDPTDEKLGNIPDISKAGSFHKFLLELHETYGPVASFWFGTQYCVSVSSADTFKDVQQLFDRPTVLFEFVLPLIGPKSIQFSNGDCGRKRHKVTSEVLGHKVCNHLLPTFVQISKELADAWASMPAGEHLPIHDYMMALAIRLISTTQLGAYFKTDDNIKAFSSQYEKVMAEMDRLLTGEFSVEDKARYKKFEDNLAVFKSTVVDLIQTHKSAREMGDYEEAPLLNCLLDNAEDEEELLADVMTFAVGGFHTTGNFLTWLFYYMALYPDIQAKVADELDHVLKGKDLTDQTVAQLTYTWQVLEETLRKSCTAPFAARVSDDVALRISGHLIPEGTPIVNALGVSLSDEKFFPESDRFDPERFSNEAIRNRPSLAFVPFGIGPRRCPGYKFSRYEAIAVASVMFQRFQVKPAFSRDVFIEPAFGFVTKPETEIWLTVSKR